MISKKIHQILAVVISIWVNSIFCFYAFLAATAVPQLYHALTCLANPEPAAESEVYAFVIVSDFVKSLSGEVVPIYTPTSDADFSTEHVN